MTATPSRTQRLCDDIFAAILDGHYAPGDVLPPERELAERSGTSRVTVRRAYAELEHRGVLKRVQGSGTRVSDQVRGNPNPIKYVALLSAVRDPFAQEFVQSLEAALTRIGAFLILKLTDGDVERERHAAAHLVREGIANFVVWPGGASTASDLFERVRVLGVNVVFIDRMLPGPRVDFVGMDNRDAITTLMTHARQSGFTDFIFVSHAGLNADSDRLREQAFTETCRDGGLTHQIVRVPWKGNTVEVLAAARHEWFPVARRGTRAVLCVNDTLALRVKSMLGTSWQVYGIDGLDEAVGAGIPTYRQPFGGMARQALRRLQAQRETSRPWKRRCVEVTGHLIVPASQTLARSEGATFDAK
ncbi:MAG: LacI family DNA-binding transcriptional regulator [Lentisphaerae bacterium]|nr:LacI family DNA-binding transcriptional regulator [Lentisphaerota bacterium]